jgi:hypothetical protein
MTSSAVAATDLRALEDDENAVHILPLAHLPLQTPMLKRARLIKNSRLEGVVEMFHGHDTGSGQYLAEELDRHLNLKYPADFDIVRKLAKLKSYDVYSLRPELRRLDIAVDDHASLRLSAKKQAELAAYMAVYTRPLIQRVYGDAATPTATLADIVNLFRLPDVEAARRNLVELASTLRVDVREVPAFLEDYGDVYLSLAYYQRCLDAAAPVLRHLDAALGEVRADPYTRCDMALIRACDMIEAKLDSLTFEIKSLTDMFRTRTEDMWQDISAERFGLMKTLISSYQTKIGENLCVLTVKARAWAAQFPSLGPGLLYKKAATILTDMRPGMEKVTEMQYADGDF